MVRTAGEQQGTAGEHQGTVKRSCPRRERMEEITETLNISASYEPQPPNSLTKCIYSSLNTEKYTRKKTRQDKTRRGLMYWGERTAQVYKKLLSMYFCTFPNTVRRRTGNWPVSPSVRPSIDQDEQRNQVPRFQQKPDIGQSSALDCVTAGSAKLKVHATFDIFKRFSEIMITKGVGSCLSTLEHTGTWNMKVPDWTLHWSFEVRREWDPSSTRLIWSHIFTWYIHI